MPNLSLYVLKSLDSYNAVFTVFTSLKHQRLPGWHSLQASSELLKFIISSKAEGYNKYYLLTQTEVITGKYQIESDVFTVQ